MPASFARRYALLGALALGLALPGLASAQIIPHGGATTVSATINAIDFTTRQVRLAAPSGYMLTLTAGPEINLQNFNATDRVIATYERAVALAISPPGSPDLVQDTQKFNGQHITTGSGVDATVAKVSGTIVSINQAAHQVDVVDASGGQIYTLDVVDPARIALLDKLKVGDTVTAFVSPQMITSMERAR